MDETSFDGLTRSVGAALNRRRLGRMAGAGALLVAGRELAGAPPAGAKKRRVRGEHNVRGNKAIMCINGVTERVPKKKRKKYLKQGATRGECANPTCVPTCPAGSCNISDGCGGTCPGCPAGSVCAAGTCRVCSVECASGSTPTQCGDSLRDALVTGGDIYLCPGQYEGQFFPDLTTTVYGSGNGVDPAVDSILIGSGLDGADAVIVTGENTYTFVNVRVTGGGSDGAYGGAAYLDSGSSKLVLDTCVLTGNHAQYGGAVYVDSGSLDFRNCQITTNTCMQDGGAIYFNVDDTFVVTQTSFTANTAGNEGGALYLRSGTTTLDATVSITGNSSVNTLGSGGGVKNNGATFNRNGATISGNSPDQCVGAGC